MLVSFNFGVQSVSSSFNEVRSVDVKDITLETRLKSCKNIIYSTQFLGKQHVFNSLTPQVFQA